MELAKNVKTHASQLLRKYQLFQHHNYVCKVLINSKKKKVMLCNLFVVNSMPNMGVDPRFAEIHRVLARFRNSGDEGMCKGQVWELRRFAQFWTIFVLT